VGLLLCSNLKLFCGWSCKHVYIKVTRQSDVGTACYTNESRKSFDLYSKLSIHHDEIVCVMTVIWRLYCLRLHKKYHCYIDIFENFILLTGYFLFFSSWLFDLLFITFTASFSEWKGIVVLGICVSVCVRVSLC